MPRLAPAAALAAILLAAPAAKAVTITANTTGFDVVFGSLNAFAWGQSVTTPAAGGPWNSISFNLVQEGGAPFAIGGLYLLAQSFTGPTANLSAATPGYLAHTATLTAGTWDFDDSVTLAPATQYFLYMDTPYRTPGTLYSSSNVYAGGHAWQTTNGDPYFASTGVDFRFALNGSEIPEPASALLLAPALLVLARRRA